MATDPKPAAAPDVAPEKPAEAVTLKSGRHKPPLSMTQQRFLLILVLITALLGSLYVVAAVLTDKGMQTAVLAILGTALVGPIRDAFRHYFPGGQADTTTTK